MPLRCVHIFFLVFFAHYFLKVHLHHSSKIKSQKEYKTVEIRVFIFAWWRKDPNPYLWLKDPDPGGPETATFTNKSLKGVK